MVHPSFGNIFPVRLVGVAILCIYVQNLDHVFKGATNLQTFAPQLHTLTPDSCTISKTPFTEEKICILAMSKNTSRIQDMKCSLTASRG